MKATKKQTEKTELENILNTVWTVLYLNLIKVSNFDDKAEKEKAVTCSCEQLEMLGMPKDIVTSSVRLVMVEKGLWK